MVVGKRQNTARAPGSPAHNSDDAPHARSVAKAPVPERAIKRFQVCSRILFPSGLLP